MSNKMSVLDWMAYAFMAIGSINWGLTVFGFNLVEFLLRKAVLVNSVYVVVAIAGIYALVRIPFIISK